MTEPAALEPSASAAAVPPAAPVADVASAAPAAPGVLKPWVGLGVVLGMVALVLVAMLWQRVANMQEQLARQSAQAQSDATEARALAKEAVTLAQDATARLSVQEARLSEVALQRSQLDELMQSLSRSRDENLVVDIDAALRLAQQQAQLTGSVEPLLAALKSAEQRVARAAQPRLGLLQRALARDIDRVKSAAVSDTPTMLVKLDELVRLLDDLPLANAVKQPKAVDKPPQSATIPWLGQWQRVVELVLLQIKDLVRVGRITDPEAVLLTPEQSFFVRENVKLKLLNARLGLLARQFDAARADLALVQSSLTRYFDGQSRRTQGAVQLLAQLQQQMQAVQLPRIDDTLAVLATAAAGR
jgi:uroporphyrin-3 C-methyltransferase